MTTEAHFCNNCHACSATKRCSRCKIVYYCNGTCQRNDWGKHKRKCKTQNSKQKLPKPNKIKIANKYSMEIANDSEWRDDPFAQYMKHQNVPHYQIHFEESSNNETEAMKPQSSVNHKQECTQFQCGNCANDNATKQCSQCNQMYYCSKQCQLKHWPKHKQYCGNKHEAFNEKNVRIGSRYMERIDILLQKYANILTYNQYKTTNFYQFITERYPKQNIKHFMNDYRSYVDNIDTHKTYEKYLGQCDMRQCKYILRHYRDRNIIQSKKIYLHSYNSEDENSVIICQFLDALHSVKYHLIDRGLRYKKEGNYSIKEISENALQKQQMFKRIGRQTRIGSSKFVTSASASAFVNENDEISESKEDSNLYEFGVRFYYHKFYKNYNESQYFYADGSTDDANDRLSHLRPLKHWYLEPKYKNMKEEVLNCKEAPLPLIQFYNTLKKSMLKLKAFKQTITASMTSIFPDYFLEIYGIGANTPITLNHIMAILLYTNNTLLCTAFSKSYRKICKNESDEQLKLRHSHFANWAKYLRECIEVYGTIMPESKTSIFYHGIGTEMNFKGLSQSFCIPTSTTLVYEVAVMFAKADGIVLTLENTGSASVTFWNCMKWSDYPGESEMLFVGGRDFIEISSMTMLEYGISYTEWIAAIRIFERVSRGAFIFHPLTKELVHKINLLINAVVNDDKDMAPMFIIDLFKHMLAHTQHVRIDIRLFGLCKKSKRDNDPYYTYDAGVREIRKYGYCQLKHLFFDENNSLNLHFIGSLFSIEGLSHCTIQSVSETALFGGGSGFKFNETILLTDAFLDQILSHTRRFSMLNEVPWLSLLIHFPKNNEKSLRKLTKKYSPKFKKFQYRMGIKKTSMYDNDPQGRKKITFGICYGVLGDLL